MTHTLTRVTTFHAPNDSATVMLETVLNLRRSDKRKWLADHITWAVRQGYGVQCEAVQESDTDAV